MKHAVCEFWREFLERECEREEKSSCEMTNEDSVPIYSLDSGVDTYSLGVDTCSYFCFDVSTLFQ